MCLLVVCNPNSTPDSKDLHAGACSNPHGFGYAIIAGDKIISNRGMSAKKIIKEFLEMRALYPESYAMWHARYATHGVKNEVNCHPFKVGGSDMTYLAHNGVLDIDIKEGDKRSDTRVFAEDTLPIIGGVSALNDLNVMNILSSWAGSSKICILTVDPSAKYDMYLVNENLGKWDDMGIWWSNQSHAPKKYPTTFYSPSHYADYAWKDDYVDDYAKVWKKENPTVPIDDELLASNENQCMWCMGIQDVYLDPYYCVYCESCLDCGSDKEACLCWKPDREWYEKVNVLGIQD